MDGYPDKRRMWSPCPRCVSGNMYLEHDGEYVCLQCGYRYNPDTLAKTPESVKTI